MDQTSSSSSQLQFSKYHDLKVLYVLSFVIIGYYYFLFSTLVFMMFLHKIKITLQSKQQN